MSYRHGRGSHRRSARNATCISIQAPANASLVTASWGWQSQGGGSAVARARSLPRTSQHLPALQVLRRPARNAQPLATPSAQYQCFSRRQFFCSNGCKSPIKDCRLVCRNATSTIFQLRNKQLVANASMEVGAEQISSASSPEGNHPQIHL